MIKLKEILKELYISDIKKEADSPRVKRSKKINVSYFGLSPRTKTLNFKAESATISGHSYDVKIRLSEYTKISRLRKNITPSEKLRMAMEAGNVRVFCSCPDFRYKGFKYLGDQLDYGIHREKRFPKIRNPKLEGSVCKHTIKTFNSLYRNIKNMASDLTSGSRNTIIRK